MGVNNIDVNLTNIVILNDNDADHRYIISAISKNEAINSLENATLNEKKWEIIKYKKFIINNLNSYKLLYCDRFDIS